jgi:hypothetical protein
MDGGKAMETIAAIAFIFLTSVSGVDFDVPAIAPAQAAVSTSQAPQLPNSRFVEVAIDVTTMVSPTIKSDVNEVVIEIRTQHEDVQVADYSPRTETYTNIDGTIKVTQNRSVQREAALDATGVYPIFATATGHTAINDVNSRTVEQHELAARQMLTAAGTLDRRTGVYFKLRSNPQTVIEGARRVWLLLEVPQSWRGDLLEVRTHAFGKSRETLASKSERLLLAKRFHVAIYQVGDEVASQRAMEFSRQHLRLQQSADQFAGEVQRRAIPTPLHQIGSVLNVVKPEIADNWLESWVFGNQYQKPEEALPVKLKVVMLDFQEARTALLGMAHLSNLLDETGNYVSYMPASSSSAAARTR